MAFTLGFFNSMAECHDWPVALEADLVNGVERVVSLRQYTCFESWRAIRITLKLGPWMCKCFNIVGKVEVKPTRRQYPSRALLIRVNLYSIWA